MTLEIWLSVSVVNSILFFFIDIPAAWAIHRGLLALQGLYLYWIAERGHKFPIARSRIPVLSGELLRGRTALPSVFVLANISIYFLLLFATLGVDPGRRKVWEPKSFRNRTTFAMPINAATKTGPVRALYYYCNVEQHEILCKTRNETHLQIWPLVYDEVKVPRQGVPPFTHPMNMSCQIDAPDSEPMLTLQCVNWNHDRCNIEEKGVRFRMRLEKSLQSKSKNRTHVLNCTVSVEEYEFQGLTFRESLAASYTQLKQNLSTSVGRAFVWHDVNSQRNHLYNRSALIFYRTPETNSSFVAIATESEPGLEFQVHPALRITYSASSSEEFLFHSCRKNLNLARFMTSTPFSTNSFENHRNPPSVILQTILRESIRAVPQPASKVGYIRKPDDDITIISTEATVLYSIIVTLAVVLYPVRELLIFVLVDRRNVPKTALFLNDFNELSKMYRATVERMSDVIPNGGYADWDIVQMGCTDDSTISTLT